MSLINSIKSVFGKHTDSTNIEIDRHTRTKSILNPVTLSIHKKIDLSDYEDFVRLHKSGERESAYEYLSSGIKMICNLLYEEDLISTYDEDDFNDFLFKNESGQRMFNQFAKLIKDNPKYSVDERKDFENVFHIYKYYLDSEE